MRMTVVTPFGRGGGRIDRAVAMVTARRPMSRPVMAHPMSTRRVTSGDGRGDGAVMAVMAAPCGRGSGGGVVMMMNARFRRGSGERERGPGRDRRERRPDETCHDSILCPGRAPICGRAVVTTHALNVFNTMGTSPGKSSLIRPGPKDSAQAA